MGRFRTLRRCLILAGAALISGCAIPLDLLNTGLASNLGFDSFAISPPEGRVIISFNNASGITASFVAAESDSATDPASNPTDVIANDVVPGEIRNRVLDCPAGVITPGQAGATGDSVAVVVQVGDGVDVNYAGAALVPGRDFTCGDVIEIKLVQIGTGTEAANFAVLVQVFPGR